MTDTAARGTRHPLNQHPFHVMTLETYEFEANGLNLGSYTAPTREEARDAFARDAGYASWGEMVDAAEQANGCNTVEVRGPDRVAL